MNMAHLSCCTDSTAIFLTAGVHTNAAVAALGMRVTVDDDLIIWLTKNLTD